MGVSAAAVGVEVNRRRSPAFMPATPEPHSPTATYTPVSCNSWGDEQLPSWPSTLLYSPFCAPRDCPWCAGMGGGSVNDCLCGSRLCARCAGAEEGECLCGTRSRHLHRAVSPPEQDSLHIHALQDIARRHDRAPCAACLGMRVGECLCGLRLGIGGGSGVSGIGVEAGLCEYCGRYDCPAILYGGDCPQERD